MYEAFYEMEHTPFARDIPPEQLYESAAIADTLGRLGYVADRQLFAVVTADAGCGKSTLIRRFVSSLPKDEYIFLYLSDSKLTPRWFYKGMLDQLLQRIDINCVLPHLDRAETGRYIQSHLTYSACKTDIFTDKALDEIYRESTGIPRRINRICDGSLMYASQQNKRLIDDHLVRFVMEHEMVVSSNL